MLKESQIEQNRAKAGNSIVLVDETYKASLFNNKDTIAQMDGIPCTLDLEEAFLNIGGL